MFRVHCVVEVMIGTGKYNRRGLYTFGVNQNRVAESHIFFESFTFVQPRVIFSDESCGF